MSSGFTHLGQARFFFLASSTKAGFFFGFTLETLFFRPTCFGFFHPSAGVFFLAARFFFALQTCCVSRTLTGIIRLEATTLTLNFCELAVKFRSWRGEVGTGHTGTKAFSDHALTQVNPRVTPEDQTEHAEPKCAAEHAGESDAQRVHVARQNEVGLDRIAQPFRLGASKD